MKILALEISTARGGLAWLDGDVDFVREWPNDRRNSASFFENLEIISRKFGAPDRLIVGLGPGSYAGTRIAISTAIGLTFGGGTGSVPSQDLGRHGGRPSIELVGYPSICAIESTDYYVIGDARRNSFFFAHIRENDLVEGPDLFSETDLAGKIDKLDPKMSIFASEQLPQFPRVEVRYPSALLLARLGQDSRRNFSPAPLEPMYLREPHITTPKK